MSNLLQSWYFSESVPLHTDRSLLWISKLQDEYKLIIVTIGHQKTKESICVIGTVL